MELRPKGCEFPVNGKDYTHKCGNFARKGKDFCWMHDGTPKKSERLQAENAKLKEEYGEAENQIKEYQAEIAALEDKIEAYSNQGESDG